mgnify:CR=1 FL=1
MSLTLALLPPFLGKLATTAALTVGISRVAERGGPFLASVIITLPIFAGPSFFFLMFEQPPGFIARGALYAFAGTGPVLAFTVGYVQASRRYGLAASLAAGAGIWLILALPMRLLPFDMTIAALWAGLGAAMAFAFRRRFDLHSRPTAPPARWAHLLSRATAAGLAVATVATIGGLLGPATTGLVVSFPLTMSVSVWLLYRQYGREFAAATLASTQRTLPSYASFCLALALLAEHLPIQTAFWTALGISVLSATGLALAGRRARRGINRPAP